jgi:hypothetical protein
LALLTARAAGRVFLKHQLEGGTSFPTQTEVAVYAPAPK